MDLVTEAEEGDEGPSPLTLSLMKEASLMLMVDGGESTLVWVCGAEAGGAVSSQRRTLLSEVPCRGLKTFSTSEGRGGGGVVRTAGFRWLR